MVIGMSAEKELHLMIVWHRGMSLKTQILADLQAKFQIANVYEISWDKQDFPRNISRFYGKKLPDIDRKVRECGVGSFLLITFMDISPTYGVRQTTSGLQRVNTNVFDLKKSYRDMDSVPFSIHATNDPTETRRDIFLLLGEGYEKYLHDSRQWTGEIVQLKSNTYALDGFAGLKELFQLLNQCAPYVVLRNYEHLPKTYVIGSHGDIDLLVGCLDDVVGLLCAKKESEVAYRVRYSVVVGGEDVYFDLRSAGDGYYDKPFQTQLLAARIYNENGFYTPSADDHVHALLYHALIHKKDISADYQAKLDAAFVGVAGVRHMSHEQCCAVLDDFMVRHAYKYSVPVDKTVHFNEANIRSKDLILRPELKKLVASDFVGLSLRANGLQLYVLPGYLKKSFFRIYISIGGLFKIDFSIGKVRKL